MKKMKRIAAIILALALCFALAACGSKEETGTTGGGEQPASTGGGSAPANTGGGSAPANTGPADSGGPGSDVKIRDVLTMILEAPIAALDPHNVTSAGNGPRAIYRCTMDRLIVLTPEGEYIPELATSWHTDDNQTFTFNLRDDVYFHNGQKFTAQDVIDTVELSQQAVGSSPYNAFRNVVSITAPDEYSVEMVLSDINVDFLYSITHPNCCIVNKAAREADPVSGAWVGTGAYKVTDFSSNNSITLTRNEDYWGKKGVTETLRFVYVPETTARLIMLQNDEAQVVTGIGAENLPIVESEPDKYTIYGVVSDLGFSMVFNTNNRVTGDKNFRAAVTYAISVPDAVAVSAGKYAKIPVSGSYWGNTTEFLNTDLPVREQDIELAKQFLAESSYSGEDVEMISGTDDSHIYTVLLSEQLRAVGINTSLMVTDVASLGSIDPQNNTDTQMINSVAPFSRVASGGRSVYYSTGGTNKGHFSIPEIDRIFDVAQTVNDVAEREAMYKEAQKLFYDEYLAVMFFHRAMTVVAPNFLKGAIIDPEMHHDFRYMYVEE